MINDFSYGRVQGLEGKNLDQEITTLLKSFPRVIEQCYPLVVKRKQCIPMSVCRDAQLFEWESIARWGNVLPTLGDANAVVTSISESTYPGELIPCLPYFSSRSKNAISCEGRLGTLRVQMGLSYLKGDENTFVANINLPEFVTEKQRQSVTRFWSAGQSIWSPLSPFSISFEQDAKSNKYKVGVANSPGQQSSRCSLKFSTERDIADCFETLPNVLKWMSTGLSDYRETYIYRFNAIDVIDASRFFEESFGTQCLLYYAHPHQGFHPDQLSGETPMEGYWHIPLFKVRLGRSAESQATLYLVQTNRERWFEIQTSDRFSQADLPKYVESLPHSITFWKGPNKERWGLNKLLKK